MPAMHPPLSRIAGSTLLSTVNTKVKGKKQKKRNKNRKKNMTQRYRWGWTGNEAGNNFTE